MINVPFAADPSARYTVSETVVVFGASAGTAAEDDTKTPQLKPMKITIAQ